MKYSRLKHELELLELEQKHEIALLQVKHEQARNEMISKCTHRYEDGTSASIGKGSQWDYWSECDICGKTLR